MQPISYCYRLSCVQSILFQRRLRTSVSFSEAGVNMPTFRRFRILLRYAGRASPRASHRAGSLRVRSRQTGTVAKEANETARLVSKKAGPRGEESTRSPSPATRRFWVLYIYPYHMICQDSLYRYRPLVETHGYVVLLVPGSGLRVHVLQ